jgi:ABC-type sugar transport system permease subunit
VSGVGVATVWSFILSGGGALDQALAGLFWIEAPPRWLVDAPLNTIVMIVAAAWQGVGVNALLFTIGLHSIPKEPLEAARLDGATGLRLFASIIWPMLRPLTTVVVGLSIVASLKTFDLVQVMTKGGPGRASETLALTMYKETFVNSDYGLGSAIALLLAIVTLLASVLYLRRQLSQKLEV